MSGYRLDLRRELFIYNVDTIFALYNAASTFDFVIDPEFADSCNSCHSFLSPSLVSAPAFQKEPAPTNHSVVVTGSVQTPSPSSRASASSSPNPINKYDALKPRGQNHVLLDPRDYRHKPYFRLSTGKNASSRYHATSSRVPRTPRTGDGPSRHTGFIIAPGQ